MLLLQGMRDILSSLSGTFSLITLLAIGIITYHSPAIGGGALIAFCSIVPAVLAIAEHREAMK